MAEAVFNHLASQGGLDVIADGAGVSNYHVGEPADPRTISTLRSKGVAAPSRARMVRSNDFAEFDHIVAMDASHYQALLQWNGSMPEKISMFLDWAGRPSESVPDPYYGGTEGFERLYEMILDGVNYMLKRLAHEEVR